MFPHQVLMPNELSEMARFLCSAVMTAVICAVFLGGMALVCRDGSDKIEFSLKPPLSHRIRGNYANKGGKAMAVADVAKCE